MTVNNPEPPLLSAYLSLEYLDIQNGWYNTQYQTYTLESVLGYSFYSSIITIAITYLLFQAPLYRLYISIKIIVIFGVS